MRRQSKSALAVGILLILGLSACSTPGTDASSDKLDSSEHHGMSHSMSITDKQSFALAMIPHHQQAVVMSEFAKANSTNPEVLAIAEQIIAEQSPEVELMTPWLEGKEVDTNMMMEGMLSTAQLEELESTSGDAFDKLYLEYMIMHHEGALVMAGDAVGLDDQELADFANQIIRTQSAEIETLMQLLSSY